ncbi:NPCBM/NEW2 domain-containing protein [Paludisphaera mucosa]|uniref:NPCBM/NEW2 domain-containing protein n=1 Tax=Paludisphaera mucosa TaxID=3030827 RepID=A0ABT6FD75_9BACT|nr:NPCBM/NEW2 domain-containing protein [Paludisphaera mucosa]MDG3005532.1 NPCBM/NEW2 domain-containing protein [Paludisphaera mucosa]
MRKHLCISLRLAAVLAASGVVDASRAEGPDLAGPAFETLTTAGPGPSGRITLLAVDRIEISPAESPPRAFATTELVHLSREAATSTGEGAYVVLPEGDRVVRALVGSATDAKVEVQALALGKASMPLDAVLGLVLNPPSDPDAFDLLVRRLRTEARTSEVVWLANGDRVAGSFLGMDDRVVRLQVQGAARELARDGVTAVGFDPALVSYPKPAGPYLEIGMLDGSRLGLVEVKLERGRVSGATRFGVRIDVPLADVVRVAPRTPTVAYLSELPVEAKSYVPYFDLVRPFQADASVEDRPLLLNGKTYDRGIGTSSRTLLAFKIQPGDLRFQATVGVDERAGALGSVVFRVLTDGKVRYASPSLTYRDAPVAVDVDLEGVKHLILATEFGERGDVRDLADWVEARIIRRP